MHSVWTYFHGLFTSVFQEKKLEIAVVEIIERSGAEDYLPTFARHRITIETLSQMTDQDFTQVRCPSK